MQQGHIINPGQFEVYYGPMMSGKSEALLYRVSRFDLLTQSDFLFIKPDNDTRDYGFVRSRSKGLDHIEYPCEMIDSTAPYKIIETVQEKKKESSNLRLIVLDEVQLWEAKNPKYDMHIDHAVEELLREGYNIAGAGLNLNYRGENFGRMGELLNIADFHYPLTAVCGHDGCEDPAVRTQRYFDGEPDHYTSPVEVIDNEENRKRYTYSATCLEHHQVPGKPTYGDIREKIQLQYNLPLAFDSENSEQELQLELGMGLE